MMLVVISVFGVSATAFEVVKAAMAVKLAVCAARGVDLDDSNRDCNFSPRSGEESPCTLDIKP